MSRREMTQAQWRTWAATTTLKDARAAVKAARASLRAKGPELRHECKTRKELERERAKAARARLLDEQRRQRDALRLTLRDARRVLASSCTGDRAAAREAVRDAERALARAKTDLAWLRASTGRRSLSHRGLTVAERREHERDEARHDFAPGHESELFEVLTSGPRPKVRSTDRMSLSEAVWDYMHKHPEALNELRHAAELRDLERLEEEERAAFEADTRKRRSRGSVITPSVVDFGEFGGF